MSASRTELIAWINELLALNYTKVEQCGNGMCVSLTQAPPMRR